MVATAEACVSRELSLSIGSILVPGISESIRLVEGRVVLLGPFFEIQETQCENLCQRESSEMVAETFYYGANTHSCIFEQ
jgi:hypothetical protein